jgi:hypothetical protein
VASTEAAAASDARVGQSEPQGRRVRTIATVAIIGAVAGAIALIAKALLFPLMSGDADEPVYVYQARMLAQGHATLPARLHAEFFYPWLFGQRGDRLFSQYQPGWPAVIAAAHLVGNEQIALVIAAAGAAIATWWLAREVDARAALFAVALFVLSPIFVVHSALYLSYLWTTALVVGGVAAALAGLRTRKPAVWAACGVLFGVAQLVRPYDALIVAVPTTVFVAVALVRGRERAVVRTVVVWVAAGLAPFLVITAVYNAHVTGNPARFPLQAAQRLDTFGFGARKMVADEQTVDYTPGRAAHALTKNVGAMPRWFAGGGIGLGLAIAAVWLARRRLETWLLVALVAAFPIAYFFWWATTLAAAGARNGLGPHYYVPAFAFLAVLAGIALQRLAQHSHALVAVAMVAIVAGSVLSGAPLRKNITFTNHTYRAQRNGVHGKTPNDSVVVMRSDPRPYTLIDNPFLVGDPSLHDNVLYAIDRGPRTSDLATAFPNRHLYQLVQRTEPGHPLLEPSYVVEPLSIRTGTTVTLPFVAVSSTDAPVVVAYVKVGGTTIDTQTLDSTSRSGRRHQFRVTLLAPDAPAPAARDGDLVARVTEDTTVQVGVGFGPDTDLDRADVWERRYYVAVQPGSPDRIAVQTPGLHFHRYDLHGEVWVRENVGSHLAEGT